MECNHIEASGKIKDKCDGVKRSSIIGSHKGRRRHTQIWRDNCSEF